MRTKTLKQAKRRKERVKRLVNFIEWVIAYALASICIIILCYCLLASLEAFINTLTRILFNQEFLPLCN